MSYQRFSDEAAYRAALSLVILRAQREICVLDIDVQRFGFEQAGLQSGLLAFLNRDKTMPSHIRLALHDVQPILTRMPRTVRIAAAHSAFFQLRQIPEAYQNLADCHLIADARDGVRRFHADHPRGAIELDAPTELRPWQMRFDELWEQCSPVTLTGLTSL
jgi:hypothetical protein